MISCLALIPRGAAKETPEQQELSAEEMEQLIQKQAGMSMQELNEPGEEGDVAAPAGDSSDAEMDEDDEKKADEDEEPIDDKEAQLLKELKMDGYEDEVEGAELFLGGHKLMVHESNAEDPYVTVPDHEDYDEEENEDLTVKASDVMICVGRTEDEASSVEIHLYDEESGNLFVHHDFNLPTFPLAMCWMNCDPRADVVAPAASPAAAAAAATFSNVGEERGSFLAVGTFQTGIEIWNLDVLDVLEPVAVLGGRMEPDAAAIAALQAQESKAKKGKKGNKKEAISAAMQAKLLGDLKPGSHADAVMCLGWHSAFRSRLASGSADCSVKLWDVCTQQCASTLDALHSNKVQSLQWNYVEPTILLTGAYDQSICMADVRTNVGRKGAAQEGLLRFSVPADIEQVKWSPHQPFLFAAALENGHVLFFDARNGNGAAPIFTVAAHSQPCTNLSFNAKLPGAFMTASVDKTVKIWDMAPTPSLVTSKDVKAAGAVFAGGFDVNYPHLLAFGGDKGKLAIWDIREDAKCRAKYGEECDGNMGRGAAPAAAAAAAPNAFAAPAPAAGASSSSAAASSSTGGASGEEKKKKKKKMKTSVRRVRDDASDDDE